MKVIELKLFYRYIAPCYSKITKEAPRQTNGKTPEEQKSERTIRHNRGARVVIRRILYKLHKWSEIISKP